MNEIRELLQKLARDVAPGIPSKKIKRVIPTVTEPTTWDYARQHGFTLVTKDVDYYDRSGLLGHPPKVIWLRCGNRNTAFIEGLLRDHGAVIAQFESDPSSGCLELY